MKLKFRQGLVRHQTDTAGTQRYIKASGVNGDYIDMMCDETPLIFTAAHQNANYLIQFTKTQNNAWGPLQAHGQTQYLYWDISLLDASVTFGYTIVFPYHGPNAPAAPILQDQHWFDTTNKIMKVWNGNKWIPKVRVFAAVYTDNGIIQAKTIGSQVGINEDCDAGNIIVGKNNYPLRDSDGTFVTSESNLVISHTTGETVRFDAAQLYGQATEFIPKYYLISYTAPRKVKLASYLDINNEVHGIMLDDYYPGEIGNIVAHGLVRNEQWNFTDTQVNNPLFCGQHGEVTLSPPAVGVSQQIGYVYDNDTIFIHIQLPVIL